MKDNSMYNDFLEMLKANFDNPEQKLVIDFYEKKFGIPKDRQLELIAYSSVLLQNTIDKKVPDLYEPLTDMLKIAASKQEMALIAYNFGRAVGAWYDAQVLKSRRRGEDDDEE